MHAIEVTDLTKSFQLPKKTGFFRSLLRPEYEVVHAVSDVSLTIERGELVGFIGPNGAGKTTTLKMLSGILHPTSGRVRVLGSEPAQRDYAHLRKIAMVMGQKSQLWWDLPVRETFLIIQDIYGLSDQMYRKTLGMLTDMLAVADVIDRPVRTLSLGQRMKCELIAALLHSPQVLFLDEPTIGLDLVVQQNMRTFIKQYNQEKKATILLTSHYMEDVKELCRRIIIIDHGRIIYDGALVDIIKKHADYKLLTATFAHPVAKKVLVSYGEVITYDPLQSTLRIPAGSTEGLSRVMQDLPVSDITLNEPKIEDVITTIFSTGI